jgi:Mrp family chromosome partitioning ATPase
MTALDQAFIKAFNQQDVPLAARPSRGVAPASEKSVPVQNKTVPLPAPAEQASALPSRPASPLPPSKQSARTPASPLSLSEIFGGVLEELEKTPGRPTTSSKNESEVGRKSGGTATLAPDHEAPDESQELWTVGNEPWAVSSEQWTIGCEPWAASGAPWAVGDEGLDLSSRAAHAEARVSSPEFRAPSHESRTATAPAHLVRPMPKPAKQEVLPVPGRRESLPHQTKVIKPAVVEPSVAESSIVEPTVVEPAIVEPMVAEHPANIEERASRREPPALSQQPQASAALLQEPAVPSSLAPQSFSLPHTPEEPTGQRAFQPAWKVERFSWPKVCRRLIARASDEFDRLAEALAEAKAKGQQVVAIGGYRPGDGATTLLLCAARRLAERGIKSVLVDADPARPRLAKRLGVQPQFGWDEALEEEERSFDQAIVESAANNMALLPMREPLADGNRPVGDVTCLGSCLDILREHYDVVLVDLGPLKETGPVREALARSNSKKIDAVLLVRHPQVTSEKELAAVEKQLTAEGMPVAGMIENFVVEP